MSEFQIGKKIDQWKVFFNTVDVNTDELRVFTFACYIFELDVLDKKLIYDIKLCIYFAKCSSSVVRVRPM